jgi:hypothetical protein
VSSRDFRSLQYLSPPDRSLRPPCRQVSRVLESLFGCKWFVEDVDRKQSHPAFLDWSLCQQYLLDSTQAPSDPDTMQRVASLLATASCIVGSGGGDVSTLTPGSFANYGDEAVRKRINAVIHEPLHYNSLLTELALASWCQSRGFAVRPYSGEGFPDFHVALPGVEPGIAVDCKHLGRNSLPSRAADVVTKGNKQIKAAGSDLFGVVLVDATEKLGRLTALSDETPPEISAIAKTLHGAVQSDNSSVSAVLLTWDQFTFIAPDDARSWPGLFIQRRSQVIRHARPRLALPGSFALGEYGPTVLLITKIPRENLEKVGPIRNRQCPCGSGRRYKHCHGRLV